MTKKGKIRSKNKAVNLKKSANKPSQNNLMKWKPKSKVGRIILKNLPFKASMEDIQNLLVEYGDLREVKLLERPDGSPVGCGFAQFTRKESAEKAIEMCNNFDFMGRKISVDWAIPKAEYILKISPNDLATTDGHRQSSDNPFDKSEACVSDISPEADQDEPNKFKPKKKMKKKNENCDLYVEQVSDLTALESQYYPKTVKQDKTDDTEGLKLKHKSSDSENNVSNTAGEIKTENNDSVKQVKKTRKLEKYLKKKGRIIIRNLSFKITEDILQEHFSKYGEITEINLLKKPDGKLVGCAFIQFERVQSAARAILGSSGKPLIGRTVVIDWAVPHNKYIEATKHEKDVTIKVGKTEEDTKEDIKSEFSPHIPVKDESDSESGFESDKVVKEGSTSDEFSKIIKEEHESDESAEDGTITDDEPVESTKEKLKKPRIISNDVAEGCTIFVKNVPFSATNEELKSCMEQFGPVVYALICVDNLTEHSKGTGFVKFKEKENAEECLKAGTELTLNNQTLDVFRALSRDEIAHKINGKKDSDKKKDSRNLYLVKEGVVMAGTSAADGVSVADMSRRLQLEKWKSQILRNLNMFVSPTRLVVHNIPPSWTDNQLWKLFQAHSRGGGVITEARIMRNMRDIDADGTGKSKEYGFVSFSTHEAALQALRNVNNNPSIFTPSKRPIVSFSIENKAILKAKQQRLERSRTNNFRGRSPVKTNWKSNVDNETIQQHESKRGKRKRKNIEMTAKKKLKPENYGSNDNETENNEYTGVISKPGIVKLRTKFSLKKQAALHAKNVKQNKKKEKLKQRMLKQHISQEPIKQPKQKQNSRRKHKEEDKTFNKLINAYKTKLNSVSDFKKWYE